MSRPDMPQSTSHKSNVRYFMDAGVAIALVVMLGGVYVFDSLFARPPEVQSVPIDPPPKSRPLRLAVTIPPHQFDDIGRVLTQLGEGYDFKTINLDDLRNVELLSTFDVVFATCGTMPQSWLGDVIGAGDRNTTTYSFRDDAVKALRESLRTFVENGGTVYASDWQYPLIALSFSEFRDETALPGDVQELDARVVDEGLLERIGKTIHLRFDLPDWRPAAFSGRAVQKVLVSGYRSTDGQQAESPLLVKFPFGKGNVIFTSFHNEKNVSKQQFELLKYLVFSTVTARAESEGTRDLVSGGFSIQAGSLVTPTKDNLSFTKTYMCKNSGGLHFVLAFEANPNALIELQVVGPNRKVYSKEGNSTIRIEIPDAAVGTWKYTATAKKMPFENFPYKLSVLEK